MKSSHTIKSNDHMGLKSKSLDSKAADAPYAINQEKQMAIEKEKPFLKNPKYFKNVKISPSAAMKMMSHVQTGVEKGVKRSVSGKPTEVMGYLIGRICTDDPTCLIISDATPLPIEGFETSVVADTPEVLQYQINWLELNGKSKHPCEKFCGWYHSHPFDIEEYSHCYLSNTDVTSQLAYQRACEKDGDPWLAIIIDPLRSLARGTLELQSFRVYPPEFEGPLNECPDGKIVTDEHTRLTLWGNSWNRYYMLNTTYFMSQLSSNVLGTLRNNFLWQNALSSTPGLEPEQRLTSVDRLAKFANDLTAIDPNALARSMRGNGGGRAASSGPGSDTSRDNSKQTPLSRVAAGTCAIASELCQHGCLQMSKLALFGNPNALLANKEQIRKKLKNGESMENVTGMHASHNHNHNHD